MAHKTLVDNTAYDIIGGKTLIDGTSYSVKNGKVWMGGTVYDVSFQLPPAVLDLWNSNSTSGASAITCIHYANGYWVVGGQRYSANTKIACIAYATSLDGTWTTKDLWTNSTSAQSCINCIHYANGYWVVGGSYYQSSGAARIAYATTPDGTWNTLNLVTANSNFISVNDITYADGYWVAVGYRAQGSMYYNTVWYSTSTGAPTSWSMANLNSGSYSSMLNVYSITYANDYWVAGGGEGPSAYCYYTTNITSTWASKSVWTGYSGSTITDVIYANGYWVAAGRYYGNTDYYKIAYGTSLDETWAETTLGEVYSFSPIKITYADDYWVVAGQFYDAGYYAGIIYSTSLDGIWTTKLMWSNSGNNKLNCITNVDGYWVVGGQYYDNDYFARLAYAPSLEELGNNG